MPFKAIIIFFNSKSQVHVKKQKQQNVYVSIKMDSKNKEEC